MKFTLSLVLLIFTMHAHSALKEYKLPTAEDGVIVFQMDDETKIPASVFDERARVIGGTFTFLPKKPGDPLQWTWQYSIQFSTDKKIESVVIEDERGDKIKLLIEDNKPLVVSNVWSGAEASMELTEEFFQTMQSQENWVLLRRITITYGDGAKSKLHQMFILTQSMRIDFLNETFAALKAND